MRNGLLFVGQESGIASLEGMRRVYLDSDGRLKIKYADGEETFNNRDESQKAYGDFCAMQEFFQRDDKRHRMAEEAAHNF